MPGVLDYQKTSLERAVHDELKREESAVTWSDIEVWGHDHHAAVQREAVCYGVLENKNHHGGRPVCDRCSG